MAPPAARLPLAPRREPPSALRLSALAPLQPSPRVTPGQPARPSAIGAAPTPPTAPASRPASDGAARSAVAAPRPPAPPPSRLRPAVAPAPAPAVSQARVVEPLARITPPPPRREAEPPPVAARREAPVPAPSPPTLRQEAEPELELEADVDAIEVHLRRAPAWRRVVASTVDFALLGFFVTLLLGPVLSRADFPAGMGVDEVIEALTRYRGVLPPAILVVIVATFVYQWLGIALMGATPGKRLLRLSVVGPDGRRPSFGRSAFRAALSIPSFLLLGMGPLLGLFTRSGRSLHDFGAGTYPVLAP